MTASINWGFFFFLLQGSIPNWLKSKAEILQGLVEVRLQASPNNPERPQECVLACSCDCDLCASDTKMGCDAPHVIHAITQNHMQILICPYADSTVF